MIVKEWHIMHGMYALSYNEPTYQVSRVSQKGLQEIGIVQLCLPTGCLSLELIPEASDLCLLALDLPGLLWVAGHNSLCHSMQPG